MYLIDRNRDNKYTVYGTIFGYQFEIYSIF